MLWARLAVKLGKCFQEVQVGTTSREFAQIWIPYFEQEPNEFNPLHSYLAQIAAEVRDMRNMWAKGKHKPTTIEQMILKFEKEGDKRKVQKVSLIQSKQFWLGGLGLTKELKKEIVRDKES